MQVQSFMQVSSVYIDLFTLYFSEKPTIIKLQSFTTRKIEFFVKGPVFPHLPPIGKRKARDSDYDVKLGLSCFYKCIELIAILHLKY